MASFLKQYLIKKLRPWCVLASGILIHLFDFDFKDLWVVAFLECQVEKIAGESFC